MRPLSWRGLIASLLCAGLVFGALKPIAAESIEPIERDAYSRGVFWEVRWPGAPANFLLGTIHSEDARVLGTLSRSRAQFDASSQLLLEMTLDTSTTTRVVEGMLLSDGQTLSALIGEELFARAAALLEQQGMKAVQLQRFKPWAVTLLLAMPQAKTGLFMDRVLYDAALAAGKRVGGLETPEEQVAVFDALPLADQVTLLRASIDSYAAVDTLLEATTQAYLTGDLAAMQRLYDEYMTEAPAALVESINERLLTARNRRMAERLAQALKQGNAFVAVGALHLPGEEGLLRLLSGQGFTLRRVE